MHEQRYWFRRKEFGWGWSPSTAQGWIATAVFVLVEVGSTAFLTSVAPSHSGLITAWSIVATIAFLALVVAKGEPLW